MSSVWISNSDGKLFIFDNVPFDDEDEFEDWFFTNEIYKIVMNNFSSCLWGEFQSLCKVPTPKSGWKKEEEKEEDDDEKVALKFIDFNRKKTLEESLDGWMRLQTSTNPYFTEEEELEFLKSQCDDIKLVKEVFDERYSGIDGLNCIYNIETDDIVYKSDDDDDE